jgi:TolB protein
MTDPLDGHAPAPGPKDGRPTDRRTVIVLVLVAALLVIGIGAGVRLATAENHAARLAVVDPDGRLSTMDGHGGSVVSYAVPGAAFQFPAWSPDGSRIAAVGQAEEGFGVYVFDARSSAGDPAAPTVIYQSKDRPPFYLYWTPDGRQLTFLTNELDGLALRVAPADATGPDSIVRTGAPMYWTWLDAGRLEVHGGDGSDAFLGEIGLDGASPQNEVPSPGVFRAPAVSRDGRYRSYVTSATGADARLVVEARDGSARNEIPVFGYAAFSFDPTGAALAFIAADEPTDEVTALPVGPLRIAEARSGSVRTVLDASVVAFFWAPDGRTIASLRLDAPGGIEARSADGVRLASAGPAARPPAVEDLAQVEGVALHLVFTDVPSGAKRSEGAVRVSELFATQLMPFFDQYALSHRLWSPDSASVVLPLVEGGETGLYVIPADGSESARLSDAAMGFWSP